jgi:hypothetical protein
MKKVILSLLLLGGCISLFSQDIEVKKFEPMAKDQTATLSPRKDINETVCGLVKVHGDGLGAESDGNLKPSDLRCRQVILDFIEQFRTALNMKDISFLKTVLGADSLGNISSDYKGNASTYLKTLIRVLKTNNKMIAKVDDIEVDQHEVKKIYMGSLFFFFGIVAIIMMKDTFSNYGTLLMIVLPKSISLLGNPV